MADIKEYVLVLFIYVLPFLFAFLPVFAQVKWGFWVALSVTVAEIGLLYISDAIFGSRGLPDGHVGEVLAFVFNLFASVVGGVLAAIIALVRLASKKAD